MSRGFQKYFKKVSRKGLTGFPNSVKCAALLLMQPLQSKAATDL
jgi:hypothetical protein